MAKIDHNEWQHAKVATKELNVKTTAALRKLVIRGKIPMSAVRRGVNGFYYHIPTLKGLA